MKNKLVLLKIVITTIFQITLYHSIPYIIYLSFGLNGASFFEFLALQSVLYISVSAIPSPGTVGVSEGGFLIIYSLLFPNEILSSAMLLSRGVSFYLFVMVSGILILLFNFRKSYFRLEQNYKRRKTRGKFIRSIFFDMQKVAKIINLRNDFCQKDALLQFHYICVKRID